MPIPNEDLNQVQSAENETLPENHRILDIDEEEASETINSTPLFSCPEAMCNSTFSKHGNLMKHLDIGKHTMSKSCKVTELSCFIRNGWRRK